MAQIISKKKLIEIRLQIMKDIALAKKDVAKISIQRVDNKKLNSAPMLNLPIDDLKVLQRETMDILTSNQIQAIDAIIYWMKSIDGIFAKAQSLNEELEQIYYSNNTTKINIESKLEEMKKYYSDAIKNLETFDNIRNLLLR